ncbi:MAG: flagellar assembly protein A [Planctomycetota bacterium]|jgi:uncharacterized protein (DUF342 family)
MLRISSRSDGLQAHAAWKPEAFAESAKRMSREDILRAMEQADVRAGLLEEGVDLLLAKLEEGEPDMSRVQVAEGRRARRGEPARVALDVVDGQVVSAGDVLGSLSESRPPEAGFRVDGEEIAAPNPPPEPLTAAAGVRFVETDRTFIAETVGFVRLEGRSIAVEALLEVSEDGLTATVRCRPAPESLEGPDAEAIRVLLAAEGIVQGVDEEAVAAAAARMLPGPPVDEAERVVVARGIEPVPGDDARFVFHVQGGRQSGELQEDGSIDFHRQVITSVVEPGDLLAEKVPATDGEAGLDVRGRPVPAEPGADASLQYGRNVEVSSDGLQFTARCTGVVFREEAAIDVLDLVEVDGDVDFSTGDLTFDRSGVHVGGTVRSTFAVEASDTIIVAGSVEDAVVRSGSDVLVARGILQGRFGSVRAGGRIEAAFANEAQLLAGDSIVVRDSVFRSYLAAREEVRVADGKGVVVGGTVVAGRRIEVRVAGSASGVRTVLQVGVDYERMQELQARLADVEKRMAAAAAALGGTLDRFLRGGPGLKLDERQAAAATQYAEARDEREVLVEERTRLLQEARNGDGADAEIVVLETIHAGVELVVAGVRWRQSESSAGGRFRLQEDEGELTLRAA